MPAPPWSRPMSGGTAYPPAQPAPRSNGSVNARPNGGCRQDPSPLAVGHLPQPPAVLPGHSHRLPPLLPKSLPCDPFRMLQPGSQDSCSRPIITSVVPGESVKPLPGASLADPGTVSEVSSKMYSSGKEIDRCAENRAFPADAGRRNHVKSSRNERRAARPAYGHPRRKALDTWLERLAKETWMDIVAVLAQAKQMSRLEPEPKPEPKPKPPEFLAYPDAPREQRRRNQPNRKNRRHPGGGHHEL